jgi:signal transduction histidine kinase
MTGRIREQLLVYISHEMRTPPAAMQFQIELLRVETVVQALADLPRIVERLTRSYSRLAELVDSILTESRIQAGHAILRLKSGDLNNLVTELADELRPEAERKGLQLVAAPAERIVLNTDDNFVRVILRNLIGNAIKFTSQGKIVVSVGGDHDVCRVQVEDEGPGIARENYQRIFEPFERVEPVANKHSPGFGLGLATSRKLSEALGGRIELQSQLGMGSVFSVVLPLRTVMAGR